MKSTYRKNFPKILPQLSSEDKIIHDDFNKLWLTELNSKKIFSLIENFNHNYSAKSNFLKNFNKKITTLEIGCGIGNHIDFEDLDFQEYHAVDLRPNALNEIKKKIKKLRFWNLMFKIRCHIITPILIGLTQFIFLNICQICLFVLMKSIDF